MTHSYFEARSMKQAIALTPGSDPLDSMTAQLDYRFQHVLETAPPSADTSHTSEGQHSQAEPTAAGKWWCQIRYSII
jgi:hypothetical protein